MYSLFLILGGILLLNMEKGQETLFFNSLHTPFLDQTFIWISRLAEIPLFIFILVVAIRFSYGKGLILLFNCSIVFVVIQFLKKIVFESQVRPALFFQDKIKLNFADGLHVAYHHSFPSGHTAAAFALFAMLAFLIEKKSWSILFFLLALMIGISRLYLLQHFFRDVYVGSIIGVLVSIVFYLTLAQSSFYQNLRWKDKSLL
ncbi:MAG: phosphatase PAP2 family protein [Bacteroidetes bacterium]|nr:phosphatase PAP2 family protein [Bacteroidota bacterium]